MSRIGKKSILVPEGVSVDINDKLLTIKGPKGELKYTVESQAKVSQIEGKIHVERNLETKLARSIHGLTRSLIANMIIGVTNGYEKKLELVGTGYRVAKKGQGLSMTLGFSHPVDITPVPGINFEVEGNTVVMIKGIDKQLVGQVAANIRAFRPPEPYKGKGVRYSGERVRRKAGKQAKVGGAA